MSVSDFSLPSSRAMHSCFVVFTQLHLLYRSFYTTCQLFFLFFFRKTQFFYQICAIMVVGRGRRFMSVFWKKALSLMDQKKIKPADLARLTGKNKSSVSDWINKGIIPRADDAVKIADLLGVSVRHLVTGENDAELSALEKELLEECEGLSDPMLLKVIKEAKDLKIMQQQEKRGVSPGSSASEAV